MLLHIFTDFEEHSDFTDAMTDTWQELQRRYEQETNFMLEAQSRNEHDKSKDHQVSNNFFFLNKAKT